MLTIVECSAEDHTLLARFYDGLYLDAFPDPDERESFENIVAYLERERAGGYGANNYHVLIAHDDGDIVGGVISDYFVGSNSAVIEFVTTDPRRRRGGVSRALLDRVLEESGHDAVRAGHSCLDYCFAEVEDPFAAGLLDTDLDPFTRLAIWARWGYRPIDFPYVQPPLSDEQERGTNLLLTVKVCNPDLPSDRIDADRVRTFVSDYLSLAMRIDDPERHPDFRFMAEFLGGAPEVALLDTAEYLGTSEKFPLVTEARAFGDEAFTAAIDVYRTAFADSTTTIPADEFGQGFDAPEPSEVVYHLWAFNDRSTGDPIGMASFFTLPTVGFGGYIVVVEAMRGRGVGRRMVTMMEAQMRRDGPAVAGWLIECAHEPERRAFLGMGEKFRRVDPL